MDDKLHAKGIKHFEWWVENNYTKPWGMMTELERCYARSNYTITKLDAEILELKRRIEILEGGK